MWQVCLTLSGERGEPMSVCPKCKAEISYIRKFQKIEDCYEVR